MSEKNFENELSDEEVISQLKECDWTLYNLIGCFISMKGYPPSVRELAKLTNVRSTSTVQNRIDRLERFGFIERITGSPRTIIITGRAERILRKKVAV